MTVTEPTSRGPLGTCAATDPVAAERFAQLARLLTSYSRSGTPERVSVVGNAPQEQHAHRAAAIDSADLVFRVNNCVLDGPRDEPRYGRRCDVVLLTRTAGTSAHVFLNHQERCYLLFEPDRVLDGDGDGRDHRPASWPADLGLVHLPNYPFTVSSSLELGAHAYHEIRWATTGTMAVWLAARLFPTAEIVLSGFSFVQNTEQIEWAHASGDTCAVIDVHDLASESRFLRGLLAGGRARWAEDTPA